MYAIEFKSIIDNGIITIPEKYKNRINSKSVKVIVLSETLKEEKKKNKFNAVKINTINFKFNREEASAR